MTFEFNKELKYWIVRRLFKYCSPLISLIERNTLIRNEYSSQFYPIFIVGAPRSGSTILYQLLTSIMDVLFINNFIDAARDNINFGFWLNESIFGRQQHHTFSSSYGNTKKTDFLAPNEGLYFYKFLPTDVHFVTTNDIPNSNKIQLQKEIYSLLNRCNKNLLIKNLSFSMRLPLIKELFPYAKIIHIKRAPMYNIQSIYQGYKNNNIANDEIWSIKPKNFEDLRHLPLKEKVICQYWEIEKQINQDLNLFMKDNVAEIYYEEIGENLPKAIQKINKVLKCPLTNQPYDVLSQNFIINNKVSVDLNTWSELEKLHNKFKT